MIDCPRCSTPLPDGRIKCLNCGQVVDWPAVIREAWPLVTLMCTGAAICILLLVLLMS